MHLLKGDIWMVKKMDNHTQKKELRLLHYTISKTLIDQRPEHKI